MQESNKITPILKMLAGVLLAVSIYILGVPGWDDAAVKVLAIATLMIFLWVTEAMPMPVVAILPLILFPLLGISSMEKAASAYSNPVIYLFFGGFMLGLAIEKWGLHRRIALQIIRMTGTGGDRIVLGFILATGLLSMWLSNTATTMMMYPIALSVIAVVGQEHQPGANYRYFNMTIMLAIAYASNIGGIATVIGTPPNVAYVGFMYEKYGVEIDFLRWAAVSFPVSILLLGVLYLVLAKWLYPSRIQHSTESARILDEQITDLGPLSTPEKRVLIIFLVTAGLWIFRSLINSVQDFVRLDDTIIAVLGAVLLFAMPSGRDPKGGSDQLLEWGDTSRMAWGILLLFGGGISLAQAMEDAGIIGYIGDWLSSGTSQVWLLVVLITILSIFISEVMSNVAQVIVFAPLVSAMGDNLDINPLLMGIPMTLAASCAGMLPMGTPPNAIVFASNQIRMADMVKAGFFMNLAAIILIILASLILVPWMFGG